jgi:hypothetical protein
MAPWSDSSILGLNARIPNPTDAKHREDHCELEGGEFTENRAHERADHDARRFDGVPPSPANSYGARSRRFGTQAPRRVTCPLGVDPQHGSGSAPGSWPRITRDDDGNHERPAQKNPIRETLGWWRRLRN